MFSRDPFTRRRRQLQRSVEAPSGFDDFPDLGDMVDTLWRWGMSLPWVVELPSTDGTPRR